MILGEFVTYAYMSIFIACERATARDRCQMTNYSTAVRHGRMHPADACVRYVFGLTDD